MSSTNIKFSEISEVSSSEFTDDILLTGVKPKLPEGYDNVNVAVSNITSFVKQGIVLDTYHYDEPESDKSLSVRALENNFLTTNFDTTNSYYALTGKSLSFLDHTDNNFSVIYKGNILSSDPYYKFNIIQSTNNPTTAIISTSVTNNGEDISTLSIDLTDLALLSNYGFIKEVATELNSETSSYIDDKIDYTLSSPQQYIKLSETSQLVNSKNYIASTDNAELFIDNTFNLTNISLLNSTNSISKANIIFVLKQDSTIIFPDNLKWLGTSSISTPPVLGSNKVHMIELTNDSFNFIAKVVYSLNLN